MKASGIGFMTEKWDVAAQKHIEEDDQMEFGLDDPRGISKTPVQEPEVTSEPEGDPMKDPKYVENLKSMLRKFEETKDPQLWDEIIVELAKSYREEAREIVQKLENDTIKTTKGNYGKYMAILSNPALKGGYKEAMILALRNAGAGRGLDDAIRVS